MPGKQMQFQPNVTQQKNNRRKQQAETNRSEETEQLMRHKS